jgi:hypothetical protein
MADADADDFGATAPLDEIDQDAVDQQMDEADAVDDPPAEAPVDIVVTTPPQRASAAALSSPDIVAADGSRFWR